jgi:hypothetical protein
MYQENVLTSKSILKDFAATQKLAAKGAKLGGAALRVQQEMITNIAKKNASVSADALKIKERTLIQDEDERKLAIQHINDGGTIAEQEEKLLKLGIERKDVLTIMAARREDAILQAKAQLEIDTQAERIGMMQAQTNLRALEVQKEIQAVKNKTLVTDAQLLQASKTGSSKLSPVKAAELTMEASRIALANAIKQAAIKKSMLDYEYTILEMQMRVLAKQEGVGDLGNDGQDGKAKGGMFLVLEQTKTASGQLIDDTLGNLKKTTALGFQEAIASGFKTGISDGLAIGASAIQAYKDSLTTIDEDGKTTTEAADPEVMQGLNRTVMRETVNGLAEELKRLGPEGELVASVVQGAMVIGDAFHTMTKAMKDAGDGNGMDKAVAMAEFASAAIGQVTQMMAANSKAQMAEMDGQIDAEKRRDGKSKESLAKIAQMEKKKEGMAKKAFDQNKKMQMAQTVVNTASGMMRAYKDFDGITATALAVMIGALGAAQLAIISKTQYQSASAGDVAKPKMAMSIGKRNNSVDVSRGGSAGELSYMRGARGTGNGANDFNPSGGMTGKRGYASGGEGILVGEQGPEIMRPSQRVDIVPNNRLGGSTNVNFSINAVDSAGVEELLVNQRGNIIRMIREAANDTGERFLETVDTQAYGSST